jgi:hypothetical protein
VAKLTTSGEALLTWECPVLSSKQIHETRDTYKNRTGGQNRSCLGVIPVYREDIRKGWRWVNMVQILCIHVCKWNGGGGTKENDGGVNSTLIYSFCKCHKVPLV